ncbi:translation initiation factor IF-2-like isoform X1 [Cyanistes caeruleus]|uniref:translation initiation factor IF-2-like isoform X1 n=1 Tax=Cyanistes caeruleus TaxID=156563 RepID=UPI000CDB47A1|nr:translation initiation factor IF-2-like isoform X1 [Cyanistes caeruleus]
MGSHSRSRSPEWTCLLCQELPPPSPEAEQGPPHKLSPQDQQDPNPAEVRVRPAGAAVPRALPAPAAPLQLLGRPRRHRPDADAGAAAGEAEPALPQPRGVCPRRLAAAPAVPPPHRGQGGCPVHPGAAAFPREPPERSFWGQEILTAPGGSRGTAGAVSRLLIPPSWGAETPARTSVSPTSLSRFRFPPGPCPRTSQDLGMSLTPVTGGSLGKIKPRLGLLDPPWFQCLDLIWDFLSFASGWI